MTSSDRFERQLPERLADLASAHVPDYFDDLLRTTARTPQRPAWSSLERWLPLDLALPSATRRTRSFAGLAVLALIGLLIAAALLALAGSRRSHVPAPFGPAANGSMYYTTATEGVVAVDPAVGAPRAILAASNPDGVVPTRDGLRIVVMHKVAAGEQLSVADADGRNEHPLFGTYPNFSEIDSSPTDTQLAIVSDVAGVPSISIVPTDGSPATTLNVGLEVHNLWYLPDGQLVFHGSTLTGTPTFGIYIVNADGTGLRPVAPTSSVDNWLSVSPSPDGTRLVYHKWVDAPLEHGRLHVIDIATGADTTVEVAGTTGTDKFEEAYFSPDGQSILFKWFTADDNVRLAVVPAGGGSAVAFGPAVHYDVSPNVLYSPDGRSVIAWYPSLRQLWLLDLTGKAGGDRTLALPVTDVPTWQRVAP